MMAREKGETKRELTVEAIYDMRAGPGAEPVHAESYLRALSEAEWAELREAATASRKAGNPLLRCGHCRRAVYGRESIQGRRHCYHFDADHGDCRWAGAVSRHPRSIDAEKFHGQKEGERHKTLCRMVEEVLALDPAARDAGIWQRRYTKGEDGAYGYPDVYAAAWQGAPAAFEIQLSTTHLPVIVRREHFYHSARIRLVWIVGYQRSRLNRRAFLDILMRNDGQILGMDGEVAATAREAGQPRFRLYRLIPGPAAIGFRPVWHDRVVGPEGISWGAPGDRPRSAGLGYDAFLDAKIQKDRTLLAGRDAFYEALSEADVRRAETVWDDVAQMIGGTKWRDLPAPDDSVRPLGVLATLRTGKPCIPTRIDPADHAALANSMLLEPPARRCWTHAFELLCRAKGLTELLDKPSVREKCRRNLAEPSPSRPIDAKAGPVFNVFFPEGAFYRIDFERSQVRE